MSATSIEASWIWEEVSPNVFWLKVMAILRDELGLMLSSKPINIYEATAQAPDYFSLATTKITDSTGFISHYFTSGLVEQYPKNFRFDFTGDTSYSPSTSLITVEYMVNPPITCPPGYH